MSDDMIIGGQEMSDMLDKQVYCKEIFEELKKTKKELEELQDALSIDTLCIEPDSMPDGAIKRAIEASRQRNKEKT